jgi:hypothetical protein
MKVTVRGWARDMGEKEIGSFSVLMMDFSDSTTVYRDKPAMYIPDNYHGGITVAWFQSLKLTGEYRLEAQFSRHDVMKLYKCVFGSELQLKDVEQYGLTFSDEVVQTMLKKIKLTDLTLGQLVAMNAAAPADEPATVDKLVEGSNVKPFVRRV